MEKCWEDIQAASELSPWLAFCVENNIPAHKVWEQALDQIGRLDASVFAQPPAGWAPASLIKEKFP